jgi:hypothetical protein
MALDKALKIAFSKNIFFDSSCFQILSSKSENSLVVPFLN